MMKTETSNHYIRPELYDCLFAVFVFVVVIIIAPIPLEFRKVKLERITRVPMGTALTSQLAHGIKDSELTHENRWKFRHMVTQSDRRIMWAWWRNDRGIKIKSGRRYEVA